VKLLFAMAACGALLSGSAQGDVAANRETMRMYRVISSIVPRGMLADACEEKDPTIHCDPYIAGVIDTISANGNAFEGKKVCVPDKIDIEKFRVLVVNFIRAHTERSPDSNAAIDIVAVFTKVYPCQETAPGSNLP
jgi:hypothetical protein